MYNLEGGFTLSFLYEKTKEVKENGNEDKKLHTQ